VHRQIDIYATLLREVPYSARVSVSRLAAPQMVEYALSMQYLERQPHPLGALLRMSRDNAILATYYRNNVLHLLAMPSLLACCFLNNATMREQDIQRLAWRIYPYIRQELFLPWSEAEVPDLLRRLLAAFARLGLLVPAETPGLWRRPEVSSAQAVQLSLLAQMSIQTIERYYLVIAALVQLGSGEVTQQALEQRCHLMAQRISLMYGLDSPEFFDKALFRDFISELRRREMISIHDDRRIEFGAMLTDVESDAQVVLSEQIRHSILQVTHA
jgi:glycerol-3-phosphate O-acyltransferase